MRPLAVLLFALVCLAGVEVETSAPGQEPPGTAPVALLESLYANGDLQGALVEGERLLTEELGPEEHVTVLNYLGAACYLLARYDDAVAYMELAIESLGDGDVATRASLLNDLGECQRAAGHFTAAAGTLERALGDVLVSDPEGELHARILNNVAGLHRDRGDFAKTEELLREALRITESTQGVSGDRLATAQLNLAELLRFQSRYAEARPFYEAALETARETYPPEHPNLVYFLNQLAVLESTLGRFESARTLRDEALRILAAQELPYPILEAMLLTDAANDRMGLGDPLAAKAQYERALALRASALPPDHWELGNTLAQLARSELESNRVSAEQVAARATQALEILDATEVAPESRADAYAVRALAKLRMQGEEARDDLDRALRIVEELRSTHGGGHESRARMLARYSSYYDTAINLALENGQVERALDYTERFRARALAEQLLLNERRLLAAIDDDERALVQARTRTAESELVSIQDAMNQLAFDAGASAEDRARELARLHEALEAAVHEYSSAQEAMRSRSATWQSLLRAPEPTTLRDAQSLVPDGERMLLYWVGPSHAWLLEIGPASEAPRAHRLRVDGEAAHILGIAEGDLTLADLAGIIAPTERGFGAGPLFEPLRGVADLVDLPDSTAISDAGTAQTHSVARLHALGRILLPSGVWKRVRSSREVTVLPAGSLHLLPFEALVVDIDGHGPRYWLDAGPPVRYASSVSTLRHLAKEGRKRRDYGPVDLLSVCNPTLSPTESDLRPLPGTANESLQLQSAFGASRVEILSGGDATESAFRSRCADRRYIHLATHGIVDEATSDVLAGLVLAREGGDGRGDGRLQLYEIDRLGLSAQLAVLSACRTAAGKRIDGEGVFALARGFHVAGAVRVVASLWSVSDASTAALMGEFFRRIADAERAAQPLRYASALHEAKRLIRAQSRWAEPFYWAPFLLSGPR